MDISRIDEEEILRIKDAFISAAVRAEKSRLDGVQLHCAHGFFLSECLSPHSNKRKDGWGGDDEGRFRTVSEIMKGIRFFLVFI